MRKSVVPTARVAALKVLLQGSGREGFAQDLLDVALEDADLSSPDRRLATQLVYGTLRRRGAIDALLRQAIHRDPEKVEAWIWESLRLGVFQLLYLDQVPAYAAINETVELAQRLEMPRAKGFINGILRKVASWIAADRTDAPASNAVPLRDNQYRQLAEPRLPDPKRHPVDYLADAFSLPAWLAKRWLDRFGWDESVRLGFWFAEPAPIWLRVNTLKTDPDAMLGALSHAGVKAEPGRHPQSIRLLEPTPIRDLPGYADGMFVVQDESAMHLASALNPLPGTRVLDLCAAPGGKTTHLAELMKNEGEIIASDLDEFRLDLAMQSCERLGISIVSAHPMTPESTPPEGPFDGILVDVPCSNTGVLGRRAEARWRLKPSDIRRLVPQQTQLLTEACKRLKPGGLVVYSTCSIEPEENLAVVESVRKAFPEMRFDGEEASIPGKPSDGGYWARLRRK
ncbi:MAG: 16S rRNA (cytosine(967)-C(5))-methyltransferase RsmB [Gemmataceae bacterium]|nr:16S rRNA (cytosine(967)-C(5))-methyltransferase RsmB [Gemmataceae bacterium]